MRIESSPRVAWNGTAVAHQIGDWLREGTMKPLRGLPQGRGRLDRPTVAWSAKGGPHDGDDSTARSRGGSRERSAEDRKSTRLNSSHVSISYAVFCLKKKKKKNIE